MTPNCFLESIESAHPTSINRNNSVSRSFRNFFRSNSKTKTNTLSKYKREIIFNHCLCKIDTNNFVLDNHDLLATPTPTPKRFSLFRRRRSKQQSDLSTNSLTSRDRSR
jgi:hypothetical protein